TRQLAEKNQVKVETQRANLLEYEPEASQFDAAVMVFGHFYRRDQKNVFEKLLTVVKPGGIIMLEVYSKEQIEYETGGPRDVEMLYDPQDMLEWYRGHRIIHFFYGEQIREEGILHTGKAHVIQLVLKKN
ncbi:class I SAM-dependent methyltransferase, partial [Butyricicoccus sp. 1XD8-22]